jgi:heme/copper-type cytochrome/quinol oxidase subunit 2
MRNIRYQIKKKIYKGYYTQTKLYSALLIWFITIFVSVGHLVFTNCMSLEQQEQEQEQEQEKEDNQQSYVNYTSFKFKVQFQYPYTWIQSEKITDKEKGSDIWVTNYSNKSGAVFWILRGNDPQLGSDLQTGIKNINLTLIKNMLITHTEQ